MRFSAYVISFAFLGIACAVQEDADDRDDSFLDSGKADDTGAITEGSVTACAVLKVVNTLNASSLSHANGVGLSSDAASHIGSHRAGADGSLNTADDNLFDTLAELDAVPYVGGIAFAKLRAYAEAHDWGATCGLIDPACGGTEVRYSTSADRSTSAPPVNHPQIVVDQLGKGWKGSVSFDLEVVGCSTGTSGMRYTDFTVVDGYNNSSSHFIGTKSYEALSLPVTIKAAGVSGGPGCSPKAYIKRIRFATVGTSCLPGQSARKFFAGWWDPALVIGKDMMTTKMKFSAKVQFYANYTAPHCARLHIAGGSSSVTLTADSPTTNGLVELESPISVVALPACTSSRLPSPEVNDADFRVVFSPFALGVPK